VWFPQARNYRVAIVETGTARGAPFIEPPARRCHSDITVVPVTRISATLQSAWDTQRGHSVRYPPCTRKKKEKLLRDSYSTCAGHSRKTRDERHSRKKKRTLEMPLEIFLLLFLLQTRWTWTPRSRGWQRSDTYASLHCVRARRMYIYIYIFIYIYIYNIDGARTRSTNYICNKYVYVLRGWDRRRTRPLATKPGWQLTAHTVWDSDGDCCAAVLAPMSSGCAVPRRLTGRGCRAPARARVCVVCVVCRGTWVAGHAGGGKFTPGLWSVCVWRSLSCLPSPPALLLPLVSCSPLPTTVVATGSQLLLTRFCVRPSGPPLRSVSRLSGGPTGPLPSVPPSRWWYPRAAECTRVDASCGRARRLDCVVRATTTQVPREWYLGCISFNAHNAL